MMHSTHFAYGFMVTPGYKEGMFYLMMHSTFFLWLYGVGEIHYIPGYIHSLWLNFSAIVWIHAKDVKNMNLHGFAWNISKPLWSKINW